MSKKQKTILAFGLLLLAGASLFPPWETRCHFDNQVSPHEDHSTRYRLSWIFEPPDRYYPEYLWGWGEPDRDKDFLAIVCHAVMGGSISYIRLFLEYIAITCITGIVLLFVGRRRQG